MVINSNISALSAARLLDQSSTRLSKSFARLSSGSKIVSPDDDSAGLAQAARFNNQSIRDNAAIQILANGISFLQTKDGFLQKVQKAFDRMSELSVLALDTTKTDTDRSNYNAEFQKLVSFINDVDGKEFNGRSLFHSNYTVVQSADITWSDAKAAAQAAGGHLATITSPGEQNAVLAQIGGGVSGDTWIGAQQPPGSVEPDQGYAWVTGEPFLYTNWGSGQPDDFTGQDSALLHPAGVWDDKADDGHGGTVDAYLLETGPELVINGDGDTIKLETNGIPYLTDNISSESAARTALTNVKSAISEIARQRGTVGALITRIQGESEALSIKDENLNAALSRIRDVDVAVESTNFARQQVLTQSGTAMLAQANLLPQATLRLLG